MHAILASEYSIIYQPMKGVKTYDVAPMSCCISTVNGGLSLATQNQNFKNFNTPWSESIIVEKLDTWFGKKIFSFWLWTTFLLSYWKHMTPGYAVNPTKKKT